MAEISSGQVRNVVLAAHTGAGKTTLADALFFTSGGTSRQGSVDDRTSLSDYEPEEQARGSSIQMAVLPCEWKGHRVNILDTPGYPDFRGDMLAAMRVADAALIVVSAAAGLETGAHEAWQFVNEMGLACGIVVNKLDRDNTDFVQVCDRIAESLGRHCVPVQVPDGSESGLRGVVSLLEQPDADPALRERLLEALSDADDDLMVRYLDGDELTTSDCDPVLKAAIASRQIVPVFAASASRNIGSAELLDAITSCFPSPLEVSTPEIPEGAQANLVFKTSADPFTGKVSYFRVYGAPVTSNSHLWNANKGAAERIGQVSRPVGKELRPVERLVTGEIGAVAKLAHTGTFDTLTDKDNPAQLDRVRLPEPVFALAVAPSSQNDLDKMGDALVRIAEEDPTLRVERGADTGETVLHGLGDIHVETAIQRTNRKFGMGLTTSLPRIPYRETITAETRVEYRHKKQTGGRGQYGHVIMRLTPLPEGSGIQFRSEVVGGNVPKEYIPAVEKGVRNAAAEGVLAGFPVVDVEVVLTDGTSHSVDSSGMAFEIAGRMGFREGVRNAQPTLLEPVYSLSVVAPDDNAGEVMGDLNSRKAHIKGMEQRAAGFTQINAEAPAHALQRYAPELRSLTHARGAFTATFTHYEPVPTYEAEKLITGLTGATVPV